MPRKAKAETKTETQFIPPLETKEDDKTERTTGFLASSNRAYEPGTNRPLYEAKIKTPDGLTHSFAVFKKTTKIGDILEGPYKATTGLSAADAHKWHAEGPPTPELPDGARVNPNRLALFPSENGGTLTDNGKERPQHFGEVSTPSGHFRVSGVWEKQDKKGNPYLAGEIEAIEPEV